MEKRKQNTREQDATINPISFGLQICKNRLEIRGRKELKEQPLIHRSNQESRKESKELRRKTKNISHSRLDQSFNSLTIRYLDTWIIERMNLDRRIEELKQNSELVDAVPD